jgi:hypothetical protein
VTTQVKRLPSNVTKAKVKEVTTRAVSPECTPEPEQKFPDAEGYPVLPDAPATSTADEVSLTEALNSMAEFWKRESRRLSEQEKEWHEVVMFCRRHIEGIKQMRETLGNKNMLKPVASPGRNK